MASKKQLLNKNRKLKKKTRKTLAKKARLQRKLQKLEARLKKRERVIAKLKKQSGRKTGPEAEKPAEPAITETADLLRTSRRGEQRILWQRASYLRKRYEYHLGKAINKSDARSLANADLVARYGDQHGYKPEDLADILS